MITNLLESLLIPPGISVAQLAGTFFGLYPWARSSVGALYFSVLWSCCLLLSHAQLFAIPCAITHQAPLSMGFPRQEYWSELPFPPPGNISDSRIKTTSLVSPALAGGFFTTSTTWESWINMINVKLNAELRLEPKETPQVPKMKGDLNAEPEWALRVLSMG